MIKLLMILALFVPTGLATAQDRATIESLLSDVHVQIEAFEKSLSFREKRDLGRVAWAKRFHLSPSQRKKYEAWHRLIFERKKLENAIKLKRELLSLHTPSDGLHPEIDSEADHIALEIITIMARYRKKWHMINSALFNNVLINIGVKKKGFCWHWVQTFVDALRPVHFKHFDTHWGVAYEGRYRENNALVITRDGADFESGLAIDAWRSSGRPFWRLVQKDRFPWKKRNEEEMQYTEIGRPIAAD